MPSSKLKRYLKAKKDPALAVFEYLNSADKIMDERIQEALRGVLDKVIEEAERELEKEKQKFISKMPEIAKKMALEMVKNPEKFMGKRGLQGPKGEMGEKGEDGKPPVEGLDYPGYDEIKDIIDDLTLSGEVISDMIKEGEISAKDTARGLEKLKGSDRLDYNALKNLPSIPEKQPKGLGGGDIIRYYDLSSQTDGATKSFTIPANKRIIWVGGTDAPGGQYRQDTDYTGSGSTTLTLTSEVMAPSSGATLHIVYVRK